MGTQMGTHLTLEMGVIIRLNYQFMRENCLTVPSRTHRTEVKGLLLDRTNHSFFDILLTCPGACAFANRFKIFSIKKLLKN
jgi:hypothetical protein